MTVTVIAAVNVDIVGAYLVVIVVVDVVASYVTVVVVVVGAPVEGTPDVFVVVAGGGGGEWCPCCCCGSCSSCWLGHSRVIQQRRKKMFIVGQLIFKPFSRFARTTVLT